MLTSLILLILGLIVGLLVGKKAKVFMDKNLTVETPVTLSLSEVEEAGLAKLIGDLTRYRAFVDTTNGEKFINIPLADLLQVLVQKMRQLNLEVADLSEETFPKE